MFFYYRVLGVVDSSSSFVCLKIQFWSKFCILLHLDQWFNKFISSRRPYVCILNELVVEFISDFPGMRSQSSFIIFPSPVGPPSPILPFLLYSSSLMNSIPITHFDIMLPEYIVHNIHLNKRISIKELNQYILLSLIFESFIIYLRWDFFLWLLLLLLFLERKDV